MKEWEVVGLEPVTTRFFYGEYVPGHALGIRILGTGHGVVIYIRQQDGDMWKRLLGTSVNSKHVVEAIRAEYAKNKDRMKYCGLT